MKAFLIAALLALVTSPAYADGVSCREMGISIAGYEHEKKTSRMSTVRSETVHGILSASYKSYYASGCSESELQTYFKKGDKPKSKKEAK